jgi:transmembrane sensor
MNRRVEHQMREAASEQAIAWLMRLAAPEATEADWLALRVWLNAAPEHREAYDRAELVSAELAGAADDLLPALRNLPAAQPLPFQPRRSLGRSAQLTRRVWEAAGVGLAAAAALAVFVAVRPEPLDPTQVYQTAKGESRLLELADGSHVRLNSASRLSVRLEKSSRNIELAEGEAAFDVAKDANRPFLIGVGDRSIRVVGTEFDVLRHDGLLKVTVRRGIVAVQAPDASPQSEPVLLKIGDQLEHQAGDRVSSVRHVDPEAAFAWREGELIYIDQPLTEVVADLNRYFATPVRVAGAAANLRFSGVLKIDREEDVVRRLQGFLQLSADRRPDGVTLRLR